jgi:hypothetical protein
MAWMERRMLLALLSQRDKSLPLDRFRVRAKAMLVRLERGGVVEVNAVHVSLTPHGVLIARRMKKRRAEKAKDGASGHRGIGDKGDVE